MEEDFDDVLVQMWFGEKATAQIQVSRNHVAGYRNETFLYGAEGLIHVGHFDEDPLRARVHAFAATTRSSSSSPSDLRDYGEPVPVFIRRFGNAYKAEVADFVAGAAPASLRGHPRDGLRAMEVVIAGAAAVRGAGEAASILLSG